MGILSFGNKKEHKNRQEKAFLEKSPYQRIEHFLHLCEEAPKFRNVNKNKGNFILEKKLELNQNLQKTFSTFRNLIELEIKNKSNRVKVSGCQCFSYF